jgi:hypothetical protein
MTTFFNSRLIAALLTLMTLPLADNLVYRTVGGGTMRILVPKDFSYQIKIGKTPGEPATDERFFCKDTLEEVQIDKTPLFAKDLTELKPLMTEALKTESKKTYFNDTLTSNGIKMYIVEYDKVDGGRLKHVKYFEFNVRDSAYGGGIGCVFALKDKWAPTAEKIFKSIRLN